MAPTTRGDYQNVRNNFILGGDQDNEKNNHEGFRYMVFIFVCYRCQEPILTAQLFLSFLIMPLGELGDLLLFGISLSVSIVNKTKPSTRRRWGDLKEVMVFVLLFILSFLSLLISSLSLLILC